MNDFAIIACLESLEHTGRIKFPEYRIDKKNGAIFLWLNSGLEDKFLNESETVRDYIRKWYGEFREKNT